MAAKNQQVNHDDFSFFPLESTLISFLNLVEILNKNVSSTIYGPPDWAYSVKRRASHKITN
jgi:hypothetical protein